MRHTRNDLSFNDLSIKDMSKSNTRDILSHRMNSLDIRREKILCWLVIMEFQESMKLYS